VVTPKNECDERKTATLKLKTTAPSATLIAMLAALGAKNQHLSERLGRHGERPGRSRNRDLPHIFFGRLA
jgi:hypothetical protein